MNAAPRVTLLALAISLAALGPASAQIINNPPVAVDDTYSTNEDTSLTVPAAGVLSNDTDLDANPLTVALPRPISGPANGTLTLNADGSFSYTPAANFSGTDSFTYKSHDGTAESATAATVTITVVGVNDPPVAVNDSFSVDEDATLNIAAAGVLANDSDPESGTLSVGVPRPVSGPSHGTLTLNSDGSFTYQPAANFSGSDSFTYVANDGAADSAAATVTITVNAVQDAPTVADDTYSTNEDTTLTVAAAGVLSNDTHPEGSPLTVASPRPISGPANGTLTLNADGSFSYAPAANFSGTDSFTYKATDGTVESATAATVTVTVVAANDPPVAVNDSFSVDEDGTLNIAAAGVLANDSDPEGGTLSVGSPRPVSGPSHGTLMLNSNGSFTYQPAANFSGTDTFTYVANDGTADSAAATVTITVNAVQEAPTAVDDSYSTNEDTTLTIAAPGVLSNDTDAEGSPLTVASPRPISGPANGTLTLNADGSFTYVPTANFSGTDSFTYKVNDGTGDSPNAATVSITVQAVNDAPVAAGDTYSTNYETALSVAAPGLLTNDTDAEGSTLTPRQVSAPSYGTLTLNADGSFTYTPKSGYTGTDSFTYTVNDGTVDSASAATVSITVNAAPEPRLLLSVNENLPLAATLDNACTAGAEAIALAGGLHLEQEVWTLPNGNLRLIVSERIAMAGRNTLVSGGAEYAIAGESRTDVEFSAPSASILNYMHVNTDGSTQDNFHAILVLTLDPSTLKLDIKIEAACDSGQP